MKITTKKIFFEIIFYILDLLLKVFSKNNKLIQRKLQIGAMLICFVNIPDVKSQNIRACGCYYIARVAKNDIAISQDYNYNKEDKFQKFGLRYGLNFGKINIGIDFQEYNKKDIFNGWSLGGYSRYVYTRTFYWGKFRRTDLAFIGEINYHHGFSNNISSTSSTYTAKFSEFGVATGLEFFAFRRIGVEVMFQYNYYITDNNAKLENDFTPVLRLHYYFCL